MQLPVKYKTCKSPANFPHDVSSIITSTPIQQAEHYLQKKTAATPVAQLPINNCRRELFNDEESEVCQGSEVSQDNAQIAHEINPTILEPIGLNSRTALAIYSITKTRRNDLKLFDNIQNNFKKKSNFSQQEYDDYREV